MNDDKRRNYAVGALALALGTPLDSLLWLGLVAACPLLLMMRGMHSQDGDAMHQDHDADSAAQGQPTRQQAPAAVSVGGMRSAP